MSQSRPECGRPLTARSKKRIISGHQGEGDSATKKIISDKKQKDGGGGVSEKHAEFTRLLQEERGQVSRSRFLSFSESPRAVRRLAGEP